jgi:hypothetical protein
MTIVWLMATARPQRAGPRSAPSLLAGTTSFMKYRLKKAVIMTVVKDELAKSNIAQPKTAFLSNSKGGAGRPVSGSFKMVISPNYVSPHASTSGLISRLVRQRAGCDYPEPALGWGSALLSAIV